MQLTTLPTPHSLPRQPQHVLTSLLDTLFEPCPQIHTIALSILLDPPFGSAFPTYDVVITVLHNAITKKLLEPSRAKDNTKVLDAFLSSHPRLGEKNAMMSALSRQEQEATCLYVDIFFRREGRGPEDKDWEFELTRLNLAYEEKFPGLRYVTFVNGRPRNVICKDMQRRIERADIWQEREDAVQAICDIARDRARKLPTAEP